MFLRRRAQPHLVGMTRTELVLVIAVGASLLAAFLPTFFQRLRTSKFSEAPENLAELHRRAQAYYAEGRRSCLPSQAGPTPAETSIEPVEVDFQAEGTAGRETWEALDFEITRGIRFRYRFEPTRAGCEVQPEPGEVLYRGIAEGDLDGDGVHSEFVWESALDDTQQVVGRGALIVRRRVE